MRQLARVVAALGLFASVAAMAQAPASWPAQEGTFTIRDFRFGTGETLPELRLHYLTLGTPHRNDAGRIDNAILLLHGTGGERHTLLNPIFSNELFGPGQPLDITRYYLVLPDDIGHGASSKPSDGLHARFPHYDYDDMVRSQHAMLVEGLGIEHLRLILGTSMGCMQTFVWGETYPGFADGLVPLACLPTAIAGRNRMMRYMAIQAIKLDPAWQNGDYTTQPVQGLRTANELVMIMGLSPLQAQKAAPTRTAAEDYVDKYLEKAMARTDANNLIYYFDASRNYDPSPNLDRIAVPVLYINSADDFINPPELGIAEALAKKMPRCRFVLLPISDQTRGHGTHTAAAVWKQYLVEFMNQTEPPVAAK
ncbi:MAG: alpha/beta fold hydrolase [Gammaproteobacteria bacterium]|nr:alpha/beta fold hydrolase [Gammaproteobacteria bacterium]